jgi:hypothetical protein
VEKEPCTGVVRVGVDVVNSAGVEGAGTTNETVHLIVLREKKLGEIRTILTGDAGNECFFHDDSLFEANNVGPHLLARSKTRWERGDRR